MSFNDLDINPFEQHYRKYNPATTPTTSSNTGSNISSVTRPNTSSNTKPNTSSNTRPNTRPNIQHNNTRYKLSDSLYPLSSISTVHPKSQSTSSYSTLDQIKSQEEELEKESKEQDKDKLKEEILYTTKIINEIATETSQELKAQGKVLEDTQPHLDHINYNLEQSDTLIGIIRNRFNKFAIWRRSQFHKNSLTEIKKLPKTKKEKTKDTVEETPPEDDFYQNMDRQLDILKMTNQEIDKELDDQMKKIIEIENDVYVGQQQTDKVNRLISRLLH